ncbi:response regulator transcription factor [Aquabacterium sp. A7-Y]|uniref:response regulator n=1 Tax=Aquabacterium sp. A7-Y TaxID=1349605 RepID=UPI00223CD58E|nr:response regulator transcription factor [Aquabacterium sp. A7-Y]MCW7538790.1 response regulator transcription factor [Aquabacterium sp. A7-Y]
MRVLLVDDHPLILSALQSVIQGLGDDVVVTGVATGRAAREALLERQGDFDLVLLDLQLGDANGFDLLADLRQSYPALPVVVISASDRSSDVIRAIDMGAMGFVPKRASNDTLCEALRLVMAGSVYVPPMSMGLDSGRDEEVPLRSPRPASGGVASQGAYQTQPSLASLGLTPRQTDVLALLLQGKPNKLIARELNLSVETVKDHVAAVLRALGVNSRTQAVLAVSQITQQHGSFSTWRSPGPPPRH